MGQMRFCEVQHMVELQPMQRAYGQRIALLACSQVAAIAQPKIQLSSTEHFAMFCQ